MAFFNQPVVRLFLRALIAGALAFATKYVSVDTNGHVAYTGAALSAALVGGVLAFAEVFTPLNGLVGLFAQPQPTEAPVAPIEPPGETTETTAV